MRYIHPVTDITNYDIDQLAQEIRSAGLDVQAIHSGNGVLLFEFQAAIADAEKPILQNIVSSHSPTWFEWTENEQLKRHKVKCAEDVDKLTAMRIRNLIGGSDPIQEQLKQIRLSLWAHDVQLHSNDYLQADIDMAAQIRNQMLTINTNIEAIRNEGKDFKTGKGW
ncbi:MAG: hypothetical protein UX37_C0016G0014 [Microgenomates group bacterium GW2011_GWA2_46_16]|nr:MAG: hypothetical protein UX37_C0016G0014 [Microgenomates group bacterium GW2011_GWA2_46_16]